MAKSSPTGPAGRGSIVQAVSMEMQELRAQQDQLNKFLWTSEVTYKHFLHSVMPVTKDAEQPSHQVLADIDSEAWHPNELGFIKLDTEIGKLLLQVDANNVFIYRTVMVNFHAAFEQYLERRSKRKTLNADGDQAPWGPYYKSLRNLATVRSPLAPVQIRTLLLADISRLFRNDLIHADPQLPVGLSDPKVKKMRSTMEEKLGKSEVRFYFVNNQERTRAVDTAFDRIIGNADKERKNALTQGKVLPIEHFYALFTFTNLNNLAFEIEEALCPGRSKPIGRVWRSPSVKIRREDLIVRDAPTYQPIRSEDFQRLKKLYAKKEKKGNPNGSP